MKITKFKSFLVLSIVSAVILLMPIRLGGAPFGHDYKFLTVFLLYSGTAFVAFGYFSGTRDRFIASLILIVPVLLIYVPIHWAYKEASLLSLPSTLSHFIGVLIGVLIFSIRKNLVYRSLAMTLSVVFLGWVMFYGYSFWINRLNYNSFVSTVDERIPDFKLLSEEDSVVFSNSQLKNKIVIFDFWATNCGICFKKFPILNDLHKKYRNDDDVLFFAVNIPLKRENKRTKESAFNHIRTRYEFRNLLATTPHIADSFNIFAYPTVLILDNADRIIYRGDIEHVEEVIKGLKERVE